jgi:hypothetical protein
MIDHTGRNLYLILMDITVINIRKYFVITGFDDINLLVFQFVVISTCWPTIVSVA